MPYTRSYNSLEEFLTKHAAKIHIQEGECWLWLAAKNRAGYGQIRIGNSMKYAHRVTYELSHGISGTSCDIHHKCHKRACINPEHLELMKKSVHATIHKTKKFTPSETYKMVLMYNSGLSLKRIARIFLISQYLVTRILRENFVEIKPTCRDYIEYENAIR